LGFAAGTKGRSALQDSGLVGGFIVELVGARPRISWLRRRTKGRAGALRDSGLVGEFGRVASRGSPSDLLASPPD
ncbi:MAG: hypothetical protein O2884_13040, partial [Chloroflexi bacterium]|nr:hypothetical protein [Chloroflexota bacterium]